VENVNKKIVEKFESYGVHPAGFYWCPYHEDGTVPEWTRPSLMRKPEPGMVLKAVEEHNADLMRSVMIGDKNTDRIQLPYLNSIIILGRYTVGDSGENVDISKIDNVIKSFYNSMILK
jgi:histidinol phosphatase-like enzyme